MQHYYHAFSQHSDEAERKRKYAEQEILPFQHYIKTAINALENKKVRARWEKVEADFNAELRMCGYLYEYRPQSSLVFSEDIKEHLNSILFLENIPQNRDYDERLFIIFANDEKVKINLKAGDIAQGKMALYKLCNMSYDRNEETESNKGFIHLDSLLNDKRLDEETREKLSRTTIKKASWSGDDVSVVMLKEWLGRGKLDLDSIQVEIKSLDDYKILIDSNIDKASTIQKDGFLLPAKLESNHIIENYQVIQKDESYTIIYSKNKIDNPFCTLIKTKKYCDFQSLYDMQGNKIEAEEKDSNKVFVKDIEKLDDETKLYDANKILYILKKIDNTGQYIKLLRCEEEKEDEDEIESPLRFFLDSDITIMASLPHYNKLQECRAKVINREEFIIELQHKGRAILPLQDSLLETKPNIKPLQRQKNAIENLIKMPLAQSHTLLKLFASRKNDKIDWLTRDYNTIDSIHWEVLTDENREGAAIQREFIQKALHTKDFALLEGPPGSGKTTTILELIAQIIKQNKRVLLCGSTHIAIDNVLERLKEKNLIEKLNIFPIRVGSEGALSQEVKEFRLGDSKRNYEDSLLQKYSVYDDIEKDSKDDENEGKIGLQFFLQCANLVCGTTIGILQYPAFKLRDEDEEKKKKHKKVYKKPIMPDFDYLIIDESSKTTFQEFLVPAIYAKKWIIVGDTRQLSPFVDSDELQQNIENLPLNYNKSKKEFDFLESGYQKACFLLFKMAEMYKTNEYKLKMAVGLKSEMLEILENEIEARENKKGYTFGVLNHRLQIGFVRGFEKDSLKQYLENMQKDWIFYDEALAQTAYDEKLENPLAKIIPHDFLDITQTNWQQKSATYQQRALQNQEIKNYVLQRKMQQTMSFDTFLPALQKELQEKSFASEIAWRLAREFELRTFLDSTNSNGAKKPNQSYTKVIDELLPKSHAERQLIRNNIATIANIALPSILEALIKGVSDRRSKRKDSAIRSGFSKDELKQRHSILSTQGRMHSDISRFPREQFYKEDNALQDLENLNREWGYTRYKSRSVWIDVKGKSVKGRNEKEAEILIKELQAFIDFASKEAHPLGEVWSVAVLSFYKGQTRELESKLQNYTGLKHKTTDFTKKWNGKEIQIKLCSVDKFQGQEADIVFLSMVRTDKIGFLDSPNRLNVGITRAKFQLVILGKYEFFSKCENDMLKNFARHHKDTLK